VLKLVAHINTSGRPSRREQSERQDSLGFFLYICYDVR
jgi:hypothetical protein